jgi:hypothetical protein
MKRDTVFFRQAELLLRVLPFVNDEEFFALKGGTAINLGCQELRISLVFNGSFKTYAEWRRQSTGRHYKNSGTTLGYSDVFDAR